MLFQCTLVSPVFQKGKVLQKFSSNCYYSSASEESSFHSVVSYDAIHQRRVVQQETCHECVVALSE